MTSSSELRLRSGGAETQSALAGIRVVDLTRGPVGGMATMVLADFGADVIKVEPPGGDPFRSLAGSPFWLRGKRSVVLDLRTNEGSERMRALVAGADVAVVSGAPRTCARLGAQSDELRGLNEALVHCAITGFGREGPLADTPGYEGVVAAKAGRMTAFAGQKQRTGPAFSAVPIASHAAAMGAVQGIVAALLARETTGRGQSVETSLLQGLLPYDLAGLLLVQLAARSSEPQQAPADVGGGMPTLNYHPVMASDGRWIQLGNLLEHLLMAFLDAAGLLDELLVDERFQSSPAAWKPEAVEEARDRILLRMRERPAAEWMEIFRANGNVVAETWLSTREAIAHPDLVANGDVVAREHPELGEVKQLGPIATLSLTPGRVRSVAPSVGAHDAELAAEAPRHPSVSSHRDRGSGPGDGRPLEGIQVLEVATIIAAPLATSMLADLGARVVKVEAIGGDPYRHLLKAGVLAVKTNAGKESICLDLKSEDGRAVVRDLISRSHVLLHNYRPAVPERLGIGYAQARELRPDVVWVAANGYGPESPGAGRPSTHPVMGAAMGGAGYQAGAGMPPERCASLAEIREASRQLMRANEANPDPNTSVVIAAATLLGLFVQRRTGAGQAIHANMLLANAYANGDDLLAYAGKPDRPEVDAELMGTGPCYRLYPAKEGWVFLAVASEREWSALCRGAGRESLATDPRFETAEARVENAEPLAAALGSLFSERSAEEWEAILTPLGVGCVRADGASPGAFFANDPHSLAAALTTEAEHARFGRMQRWGPLVTCGGGSSQLGPGPLAGEHTDAILRELGRTPDEIVRLRESGVVGSEPVGRVA